MGEELQEILRETRESFKKTVPSPYRFYYTTGCMGMLETDSSSECVHRERIHFSYNEGAVTSDIPVRFGV